VLAPSEADVLRAAVRERWNVVISGGPGSGKTTFANALLHEMGRLAETERVVILEDTFELRCSTPNHLILHTSGAVDLRRLVHAALRLRPDRLVVGEVRRAEALELLKAWNTGNPGGLATVHANNAEMALERLDQLAQEAGVPSRARLVAQTVDVVVHLERRGSVRRVRQLVHVVEHDPERGFVVDGFFPEIEIEEVEK
jgi:type IV secretion system protein VirB11